MTIQVRCLDCNPPQLWVFPDFPSADAFTRRHTSLQGHALRVSSGEPDTPGWEALLALGDAGDTYQLRKDNN